jgi:hypothetical protein
MEVLLDRVAGRADTLLSLYLQPDAPCPHGVGGVLEKEAQLARRAGGGILVSWDRASHSQATDARGVVRLVMAVGHDQHRTACTEGLRRGADAAVVDNRRRSRKELGVGSGVADDHSRWRPLRETHRRAFHDDEHRPAPQFLYRVQRFWEEPSRVQDGGGA